MKLKRVVKSDDNWQKCCRWCHYYQNGKCWNKEVSYNYQNGLMYSLMEIFDEWRMSGKRKAEFKEHFKLCWGEFADMLLKEELDEAVSIVYQNHLDPELEFEGTYIDDPNEFCCKEWC